MSTKVIITRSNRKEVSVPYWPHGNLGMCFVMCFFCPLFSLSILDMSKISVEDKRQLCVRCNHYGCGMQSVPFPCLRMSCAEWQPSEIQPDTVTRNTQCPCFATVVVLDGVQSSF